MPIGGQCSVPIDKTVEYARRAGLLTGPVDENLDEPKPV